MDIPKNDIKNSWIRAQLVGFRLGRQINKYSSQTVWHAFYDQMCTI